MKKERYLKQLEAVINQASTDWEIEEMRKAIIEARALIENKAYAIKQKNFKTKQGVNI